MSRGEPLDPRLRALLDVESRREAPSSVFREKVRTAVEAQIGGVPSGAGGHADPSVPAGAEAAGNGLTASAGSATSALGALLTGWPAVLIGTLAGAAIGATTYGLTVPPEVRTVYVDRVVTAPANEDAGAARLAAAPTLALPLSELPSEPVPPRPRAAQTAPVVSVSRVVDAGAPDLAADRSLLDSARTALSRGDAEGALVAVQRHRDQFPRSQLLEEREIIGVQALMAAGKREEAREAATEFIREHPHSPFATVLKHVVGE